MKKDLINEMLRLTKLQMAALAEENTEEFTSLLDKRQICIDKINNIINSDLDTFDDADKEMLREMAEMDKKNSDTFNIQFEEVKLQLRKIRNLKRGNNIYSNPYNPSAEEGIFIDKK